MKRKSSKILVDIRTRLKVQPDSLEARLHEYLKDERETNILRQNLILEALITHFSPLIHQQQGATPTELRQSLIDVNQAWQMHFRYLQQRLGIDLTSDIPTLSPVWHQAEEKLAVVPTSEEVSSIEEEKEEEEEEVYPAVFD